MSKKIVDLAIKRGVDLDSLPKHLAIIMDGNGRWAKTKGWQRLLGHREGYRALRSALLNADDLGIKYLTVYAFSAENWKRPAEEVAGLMKLIDELPQGLQDALNHGMEVTANNTGIVFTLAVNYGGRAEIVDAVRDIVAAGFEPEDITDEIISAHLYNPQHPEPDLMIRTAGEMRWSNFLLWQGAYCELYVTEDPWPEFSGNHMIDAVLSFQTRTRKFGAVVE
jgi:undecaprenyl diphosphate synthase